MTDLIHAKKNPALIETLLKRRSTPAKMLGDPGPSPKDINIILHAGARVPDHGKLFPWWFITFTGNDRATFGKILRDAQMAREPKSTDAMLDMEQNRFMRAPLVIAVISRPRESAIPVWEQILSAGAACQNICLAANGLGYGSHWLTEWYAYDETVRAALKLDPQDNIAGFIYIGTPKELSEERDRPALHKIKNDSFQNVTQRGSDYEKKDLGFCENLGFNPDAFRRI